MSGDFLQIADSNTPQTGQGVPVSPTNPVPVSLVGGSSGPDRELVVTTYSVKTAFTGASVGDTITCVRVLDVSATTPTTVATIWRNETTNTDLSSAPSAANLLVLGKDGATETTLSALSAKVPALVANRTPVDGSGVTQPVSAAALPLPAGAATEASLITRATEATLAALQAAFGLTTDAFAAGDTGTYTFMAYVKRMVTRLSTITTQLPASLGIKAAAASLSVAPASDANASRELYTVTAMSAATPAGGGTGFTTFASQVCTALEIINTRSDAVDIEYNRGSGPSVPIPAGYTRLIDGITNASQIGVRRRDQVATAVTVIAEARAVA